MTALQYPGVALDHLHTVLDTQRPAIEQATGILVDAIAKGGIIQAFGTGHSRAVTLELAGRAGGLAAVGMLAVKDLVLFGDVAAEEILDPTYERRPGLAAQIYDLASPDPADAFVIVSNSGINAAIVEMAELARSHGHAIIAITSRAHNTAVATRHRSGRGLAHFADVVIDNSAPAGDATIDLGDGIRIGAVSNLTGILIAQMLAEGISRQLQSRNGTVPVFVSANLPEGDAHNKALYTAYGDRVRPIEP
ncbi:putative phosphosugar-binding protein [Microbacterium trichothecenolyticum]|uniref:SIS domain-containing protein n=1 Tax=Microbacterium trichothecenolyticum TaxID=69370 RepID=UPI002859CB01|nr:SIS domain-containing protein [Microbacterium trichothecenolyticum]MDR7184440.1 putative phosphosugar-binding protein [Microbacterium trichothecenolyticum]